MEDPNADTEWNDVLRKKGILPPKEKSEYEITQEKLEEMLVEAIEERSGTKKYANMGIDELDEFEDELDDEAVIQAYRRQRMAEAKEKLSKEVYGTVREISKDDWTEQVNNAGQDIWVVVHLYQSGIESSKLVDGCITSLAVKFKATKFLKILSTRCIENYPDHNLPTIFVYRNGELKGQLVGRAAFGTTDISVKVVEEALSKIGAFGEEHRFDTATNVPNFEIKQSSSSLGQGRKTNDSDSDDSNSDDDW
eukprot:CFRG1690T1